MTIMETKRHLALVPGMMCDKRLWAAQIDYLQAHCASITVVDTSKHHSVSAMAQAALAGLPDRFAVAGLSMGGFVALELWKQSPERISHLALLNTNAHADLSERSQERDKLLQRAIEGEFQAVITEALKPVYLAAANKNDRAILSTVMKMAIESGTAVFARQCAAIKNRSEYESILATINVPVLILCGVEDVLCPVETHAKMAAQISNSCLKVIADSGHLSTLEQPHIVNAEMQKWLSTD